MGDRRKAKKGKEFNTMTPAEPISKLQKKVTDWLRKNVPTKRTKFLHAHVVEYFVAAKAVDALLHDSPWAQAKVADLDRAELVFGSREQCVTYLDELLRHKMFHRAKKIPVADKPAKKDKKKSAAAGESEVEATPKPSGDAKEKKKRRIRLDMHLEQVFVDTNDAYVWLYDPVSWVYWLGGTAIVLGTIAVCMFPLWPPIMRTGVHYLSIGAAGFLLLIMGIAVFKYILFATLFALSGGKLKFWLFPNLTEDVGFIESFLPVYDYTYTGASFRRKKEKDSDDEQEDDSEDEEAEEKAANADQSESDESTSKKSSTGKDFEMVDKSDTADEAP